MRPAGGRDGASRMAGRGARPVARVAAKSVASRHDARSVAAPGATVATRRIRTPVGEMLAGASDDGVCLLEFVGRRLFPEQMARLERFVGTPAPGPHPLLDALEEQLDEYFAARRRAFDLPLVLAGTPFQERVWRALLEIPCGQTISYAELAARVGSAGGSRAVGRANGHNRIAIVVPCHRVVRADGSLGGYGGGLAQKRRLLALETGGRAPSANGAQQRLPLDDCGELPSRESPGR